MFICKYKKRPNVETNGKIARIQNPSSLPFFFSLCGFLGITEFKILKEESVANEQFHPIQDSDVA